jgi:hypothetical protein
MQAMFNIAKAPQVGGFVRSYMGTRLWLVVGVVGMPAPLGMYGSWVCVVVRAGHITRGVWHPPGNTQRTGYGHLTGTAKLVHAHARALHPVTLGPGAPTMPPDVAYLHGLYNKQ